MKYVPLSIAAVAVATAVVIGLFLTKDPRCLLGLIVYIPIAHYTAQVASRETIRKQIREGSAPITRP